VDLVALHAWSDADVSDIPSLEWSASEVAAHEVLAERIAGWRECYPDVTVNRVVVWVRRFATCSKSRRRLNSWS